MTHADLSSGPGYTSNNTVPETAPSSSKLLGHSNDHTQHSERLFIGPMMLSAAERNLDIKDVKSRHDTTSNLDGVDVFERHAFQYFLHRGGIEEDWESQESLRDR
jgi:hypothetical protein